MQVDALRLQFGEELESFEERKAADMNRLVSHITCSWLSYVCIAFLV